MDKIFIFVFVIIVNLGLGIMIFARSRRNEASRMFSYVIFSVVLWTLCNFFADYSKNKALVFFLSKAAYFSAALIVASLLNFAMLFPRREKNVSIFFLTLLWVFAAIICVISFTNLIISRVEINNIFLRSPDITTGPLYILFSLYFLVYLIAALVILIKRLRSTQGVQHTRILYLLSGIVLTAIGASLTNLIIPFLINNFEISSYGPYFTIFFVGFTSYAIIRHRLFDISVVIRFSIIYSLLVALITLAYVTIVSTFNTFIGDQGSSLIYSGLLTGLLVVFGYQPLLGFFSRSTDRVFFKGKYDYKKVVQEFSDLTSSLLDMDELLGAITKKLVETLKTENALVFVYNRTADRYKVAGQYDAPKMSNLVLEKDDPAVLHFAAHSELVIAEELDQQIGEGEGVEHKPLFERMQKLRWGLIQPIIGPKAPIGFYVLGRKKSGDIFTQEDIRLLDVVASQSATAIDNTQLYEETKQQVKELAALNDVSGKLISTLDVSSIQQTLVKGVQQLGKVDRVLLYIMDKKGKYMAPVFGVGGPESLYRNIKVDLSKSIFGKLVKSKKAWWFPILLKFQVLTKSMQLQSSRRHSPLSRW